MSMASELTCSICLEIYTDPLQLSCLHSYCRQCLKDIQAKTQQEQQLLGAVGGWNRTHTVKCPDCRKTTTLDSGIDGLPRNFTLDNISAKFKESLQIQDVSKPVILCSLCETNPKPAVKTCQDCSGTNYCVDCLQQFHPLRGAFKNHNLCDPGGDSESISQQKRAHFPNEPAEVSGNGKTAVKTFFCSTCGILVSENILHEHNYHTIQTPEEAVPKQQAQLKVLLQDLSTKHASEKTRFEKQSEVYQTKKGDVEAISRLLTTTADKVWINFSQYKDTAQQFISEVGDIVQAANRQNAESLDHDGMIAYLKDVTNLKSQIQRVNMPRSCLTDPTSVMSFRQNLYADIGGILETNIVTSVQLFSHCVTPVCKTFSWHATLHHPSIAVLNSGYLATPQMHSEEVYDEWFETEGDLRKVHGCCSSVLFDSGSRYWDVLVKYQVLRHINDNNLLVDLGICLEKSKDSYSPLSANYQSLGCSLFKAPDMPVVDMDFWDGRNRTFGSGVTIGSLSRRKEYSITLGFFLDFPNNTFKIIDVEENKILMVFRDVHCEEYVAECDFHNEEKVRVSVELFPDGDVSLPTCLFD